MAKNALLAEYTAAPGPGPDPATEPTNRILPGDGCSMQYRVHYHGDKRPNPNPNRAQCSAECNITLMQYIMHQFLKIRLD